MWSTQIRREAAAIRRRGLHNGWSAQHILAAIRRALPEVSALEGWCLALGWSRAQTVGRIAALYRADGLHPPGPSESMLCRWEHGDGLERPGDEYTTMLCRVYTAPIPNSSDSPVPVIPTAQRVLRRR